MGRTVTANDSISSAMFRRHPDSGEIVEIANPDRNQYVTNVPRGTLGRFELSGVSDPFKMTSTFNGSTKEQDKVRVEFTIVKLQTKDPAIKALEGRRFTELYTFSVGPMSHLGQLLAILRGRKIEPGETVDVDAFIGTTFVCSTKLDEGIDKQGNHRQYPGIVKDTIQADKIEISPWVQRASAEPEPELVGVGAARDEEGDVDPFEQEDDL